MSYARSVYSLILLVRVFLMTAWYIVTEYTKLNTFMHH